MKWDTAVDKIFQLQNLWAGINGRCNSPKARSWKDYGAKGITLCSEWTSRRGCIKFVKWALANGYKQGLVIDRINNDLGYSPKNCRFTTQRENCWNKSNNLNLTYKGETKCSAAWGNDKRCKVHSDQFQQRVKCGWSIERALLTPLRKRNHGTTKRKEKRRPRV